MRRSAGSQQFGTRRAWLGRSGRAAGRGQDRWVEAWRQGREEEAGRRRCGRRSARLRGAAVCFTARSSGARSNLHRSSGGVRARDKRPRRRSRGAGSGAAGCCSGRAAGANAKAAAGGASSKQPPKQPAVELLQLALLPAAAPRVPRSGSHGANKVRERASSPRPRGRSPGCAAGTGKAVLAAARSHRHKGRRRKTLVKNAKIQGPGMSQNVSVCLGFPTVF